ncbi:OmpA family protein [Paraburkholderia antibiotica]|uniref:OmpA family protein n=1 Tax=Paraburkholderia antibiotica TaxID=2728839 RepID=UPI001E2B48F8|nr:OmpA family protein [Paraburkholderia antibiotica]
MIWIAPLVAGLIWLYVPARFQPWWPVVPILILLAALGVAALAACAQRREARIHETIQANAERDLPIILVVGPYAGAVFEQDGPASMRRHHDGALWLRVKTPDELADFIATINTLHQRLPAAVLMPVIPDGDREDAVLRQAFSRWRHELDKNTRHRACVLPCYLAIYACLGASDDVTATPVWFGDTIDITSTQSASANARQHVRLIRHQLDQAWFSSPQKASITHAGLGHAVFDWLEDAALLSILSLLANTAPFSLRGVLLANVGHLSSRAGAWARWLTGKTSLQLPSARSKALPLPFPLPEIAAHQGAAVAAVQKERDKPHRWMLHAMAASATALLISVGISGWSNSRMVGRVAHDLDVYAHTPASQVDAKREQVETLRSWNAKLVHYAKTGIPGTLGWGLYRGAALQAALEQTLSAWQPPPVGVTIDNLSLFDSGKTTLKPGAEPKLQAVLDLIRTNPDKRILISGYTDNIGISAANQKLSEARARAIRDWFVNNASLPVTRFAIQGYGDTRPLVSNQSEQGRETNRRVEITLIPESGTH